LRLLEGTFDEYVFLGDDLFFDFIFRVEEEFDFALEGVEIVLMFPFVFLFSFVFTFFETGFNNVYFFPLIVNDVSSSSSSSSSFSSCSSSSLFCSSIPCFS
jgi:hypothetical protein